MKTAISVRNISKKYQLGDARSELSKEENVLWALREVSFDLGEGEVLGLLGKNGAGKSTLLKILSRITTPTSGSVKLYGRVASLLEVGTGFHPDLTGRENVFLNGSLHGLKRREVLAQFDNIVEFSEIGRFIDTPVKRYSSGMYMRLAFAVAAHLQPEILIVDEVLAVGDASFQRKCLGKMGDIANSTGRTIVFVSHNQIAVRSLCNRAILLQNGMVALSGETSEVLKAYLDEGTLKEIREQTWAPHSGPGNEHVRLISVRLQTCESTQSLTVKDPFVLEVDYSSLIEDAVLTVSILVKTEAGVEVFSGGSYEEGREPKLPVGEYTTKCFIPGDLMNDEIYRVQVLMIKDLSAAVYILDDALVFQIHDTERRVGGWFGKWQGVTRPALKWETCSKEPYPLLDHRSTNFR